MIGVLHLIEVVDHPHVELTQLVHRPRIRERALNLDTEEIPGVEQI